MKKLKWLALIAFCCSLNGCEKKAVEEPKVENCAKVRFLGVGCRLPFFETLDTTKIKGTYVQNWIGTDQGSAKADNSSVFVNYYPDTALVNKLILNKIYYVEYEIVKDSDKLNTNADRKCYPGTRGYQEIIIKNLLNVNCKKL